jgi:hypothetical protein
LATLDADDICAVRIPTTATARCRGMGLHIVVAQHRSRDQAAHTLELHGLIAAIAGGDEAVTEAMTEAMTGTGTGTPRIEPGGSTVGVRSQPPVSSTET